MQKQKITEWIKRIIIYILGMFIIALGVNVAKKSALGISPNNAVPFVLAGNFPQITTGDWVSIVFSLFVLLQWLILGKDFKWYYIFQFVISFIFGRFVNWSVFLVPNISGIFLQITYIILSTFLIALGIILYLAPNIMSMPAEGVAQALAKRTKKPLSACKMAFDVFLTLTALLLSFIFFGEIREIGVGTIILAFGVGYVIKLLNKAIKHPIQKFLYGKGKSKAKKN